MVALDGLAEKRAGLMESPWDARLLEEHSIPETGTGILVTIYGSLIED